MKKRIFQIAKELNISSDTLINFLRRQGFDVSTYMSPVDDKMMSVINKHFKHEREVAERMRKKREKRKHVKEVESRAPVEKMPVEEQIQTKIEVSEPEGREERKESEKEEIKKPAEADISAQVAQAPVDKVEEKIEKDTSGVKPSEDVQVEEAVSEDRGAVSKEKHERIYVKIDESREKKGKHRRREREEERKERRERRRRKRRKRRKKFAERVEKVEDMETKEEVETQEIVHHPEVESQKEETRRKKQAREERKKKRLDVMDEELKKPRKLLKRRIELDEEEIRRRIEETLAQMEDTAPDLREIIKRKKKRERQEQEKRKLEQLEQEKRKIKVAEFITVNELANLIGVSASEIIKKCLDLGLFVSINQRLDFDTILLIAGDYGFEVEREEEYLSDILMDEPDNEEDLEPRPPIVTIMGHVDHGKTTLLDYIRQSNIVAGEAGGITQHIGAYQVSLPNGKQITFIDTPGHEAFTAMRARGAHVTDIVVLVVAADDSVMPQTVEAINHALAANVPIIVAINKIDKPEANPDKIKQQLAERGVLIEEWGGKYQCVEISAKYGTNVDVLLEKILLEAELMELKANPKKRARGVVIESKLDKGRGPVGTVIVQNGTLKIGDPFVAGTTAGRVRAMFDERGNRVEIARPSTPVQVTGFDELPEAGDSFVVVESEKKAREVANRRAQLKREQKIRQLRAISLDKLSAQIKEGKIKELPVIIKADVNGSVEAIADSLMKLATTEVQVKIIHRAVGAISESDVLLAQASGAIIIGFNVRPTANARRLAEQENVEIRLYNIIYNVIEDVKRALEGMLEPELREEMLGVAEVRETFKISKVGTVAGCFVMEGKIVRSARARLVRNGIVIYDGKIASLKRFKDDAREVEQGLECGIALENFNDIKVGDVIEAYNIIELKRKLEQVNKS
jgi:translation initiation factor IF-2